MGIPRIYNGKLSVEIPPQKGKDKPVPPLADGDGTIFISVASYRDGERCGETLKSIFENAKNPDKVVVGLVEQNAPDDKFCLEEYCNSFGVNTLKRSTIRKDMVKVTFNREETDNCPRYGQIRKVAFHDVSAKGPMYARSLTRKTLANEEFCMQVDAHTTFVDGWDEVAKEEWKNANNEFAVISTAPAPKALAHEYSEGGEKFGMVPRQCKILFRDNGFPDFAAPADAEAADLEKPLLAHAWSAAFSFAKCHLEESAPYDPFAQYAMPIEQFSRYARFWTRGYDVYTPTRNIVFHDYGAQANGHGNNEWFKRQRDSFRQEAIVRVKTVAQLPGGDRTITAQANLGIYGLGRRRSIQQLMEFSRLKVDGNVGNKGKAIDCVGHEWVPYDASISPVENLFDRPDNLDPQPEYPLRTNLVFYQQVSQVAPKIRISLDDHGNAEVKEGIFKAMNREDSALLESDHIHKPALPSFSMLFILWVFGLIVWCVMFMNSQKHSGKRKPKKKVTGYKDK